MFSSATSPTWSSQCIPHPTVMPMTNARMTCVVPMHRASLLLSLPSQCEQRIKGQAVGYSTPETLTLRVQA